MTIEEDKASKPDMVPPCPKPDGESASVENDARDDLIARQSRMIDEQSERIESLVAQISNLVNNVGTAFEPKPEPIPDGCVEHNGKIVKTFENMDFKF